MQTNTLEQLTQESLQKEDLQKRKKDFWEDTYLNKLDDESRTYTPYMLDMLLTSAAMAGIRKLVLPIDNGFERQVVGSYCKESKLEHYWFDGCVEVEWGEDERN